MTVLTRNEKGSPLTHAEVDQNFVDLREGINSQVPKTMGAGVLLGPYGSESYAWRDLTGVLQVHGDIGDATRQIYRGGIKALQFAEGESAYIDFHMPHDYAQGTDIYIHAHWSHIGTLVTGGSTTWGFEVIYAKGHDQAAFEAPKIITVAQNASSVQYRHLIAEGLASTPGGSGVLLDTSQLEVDGLIQCRIYLDSNDMTVSGGGVPNPFVHTVDIHYLSTNVGTKAKAPDFWT